MKTVLTIQVNFDNTYGSIESQLNRQGLTLGAKAEVYERIREYMNFLETEDVLTEKDVNKAYNRLVPKFIEDTMWKKGE